MAQDVLSFMENRKENRSWYRGSRIAVSVSSYFFKLWFYGIVNTFLVNMIKKNSNARSFAGSRWYICLTDAAVARELATRERPWATNLDHRSAIDALQGLSKGLKGRQTILYPCSCLMDVGICFFEEAKRRGKC